MRTEHLVALVLSASTIGGCAGASGDTGGLADGSSNESSADVVLDMATAEGGGSDATNDVATKEAATSDDAMSSDAPADAGVDSAPVDPLLEASLKMGQIAVWSLDGDGLDRSGNHLDLTVSGPTFVQGAFGQALSFTGDIMQTAMRPMVDPSLQLSNGDYTISLWVKLDVSATAPMGFLDMGAETIASGWGVGTPGPGASWLFLSSDRTPVYVVITGDATPNGTFHHVVCTRGGFTLTEYVDQVMAATATAGDGGFNPEPDAFRLGSWGGGIVDALKGVVDDVAIWSRALGTSERVYLYTHAVPHP
jgi:hypothetical protein